MKVFALVILVIGSSSGLGSGPYLPSGWKPAGPAFYLPTETEKPVAIPLKDVPVEESESSGSSLLREYGPPIVVKETEAAQVQVESEGSSSDALREYGPPSVQEVSQDITQQALPEPITEQAFVVIDTTLVSQNQDNTAVALEVVTEKITSDIETITELQNTEEQTTQSETLIEGRAEVESQTESSLAAEEGTTEKVVEVTEAEKVTEVTEITQEEEVAKVAQDAKEAEVAQVEVTKQETVDSNNVVAAIEQKLEEVAEVRAVEAGVKNIAEALINLENEIKAQQVQTNEEVPEVRTIIQGSTQNAPEGLLEYGPPGFTEYGPPKGDLKVVPVDNLSVTNEISETRRRRFSPKFRAPRRNN